MNNPFVSFTLKAISLMALIFALHLLVLNTLNFPLFDNRIIASYIINLLLVVLIFVILYVLKEKFKNQLGFLFLAGSIIKFAVFFIFFYPFYRQDGDISKLEFAAFFIPYATGLILETISLSKWLNTIQ